MIQELQAMGRAFQAGCATIGTLFRWGAALAVVLAVLVNYGLSGLSSLVLIVGVVLLSLWLGSGGDEAPQKKPSPNVFNEPEKFGPTLNERLFDPAYSIYAENCFHKRYHGKD